MKTFAQDRFESLGYRLIRYIPVILDWHPIFIGKLDPQEVVVSRILYQNLVVTLCFRTISIDTRWGYCCPVNESNLVRRRHLVRVKTSELQLRLDLSERDYEMAEIEVLRFPIWSSQ